MSAAEGVRSQIIYSDDSQPLGLIGLSSKRRKVVIFMDISRIIMQLFKDGIDMDIRMFSNDREEALSKSDRDGYFYASGALTALKFLLIRYDSIKDTFMKE